MQAHVFVMHAVAGANQTDSAIIGFLSIVLETAKEEGGVIHVHDYRLEVRHLRNVLFGNGGIVLVETGRDGHIEGAFAQQCRIDTLFDMGTAQEQYTDIVQVILHILALVAIDVGTIEQAHLDDGEHEEHQGSEGGYGDEKLLHSRLELEVNKRLTLAGKRDDEQDEGEV